MSKVLLSGAGGVVGYPLVLRLDEAQLDYKIVSRRESKSGFQWDLDNEISAEVFDKLSAFSPNTLLHCAPIWLLPKHLPLFFKLGIKRMVVFSSSSVSSKKSSNETSEQHLVENLQSSEQAIKHFCAEQDIALTIFRPTMIYGNRRDQNIYRIARFVSKYGLFIVAGEGNGLRQPIHANDLADTSLSILRDERTFGKTYYLAGADVMSYRDMVNKIFLALNRKPKILSMPVSLYRITLKFAALTGRFSYTPEMANRMNQDLNYDISDAEQDFGYAPQPFLQRPQQDLPTSSV